MEREIIEIDKEQWGDYTGKGPWELNGEVYYLIEDILSKGDGECYKVIIQRKSDNKYFEFSWCYDDGNYYFDNELREVFPETIIKTRYK